MPELLKEWYVLRAGRSEVDDLARWFHNWRPPRRRRPRWCFFVASNIQHAVVREPCEVMISSQKAEVGNSLSQH
jgi:hypothetical protein